ncbi:hypothetical protein BDFG_07755, partial [Blastomyces dermatitidis ATCC 26199]
VSRSCGLSLIQLASHVHSHKETFTILHHSFTHFSYSSIIIFIIIIIEHHHFIQDFYLFFYSTLFICSSITLYTFLAMTSHSHNKCSHSAHTEQFVSKHTTMNGISSSSSHMLSSSSYTFLTVSLLKSSHVDRSVFTDDSELNVESLIKNLKNVIMKKLSVSYIVRSSMSLLISSAAS